MRSANTLVQVDLEGIKLLQYYRGIEQKDFLFDDEDCLSTFLSLSEECNFKDNSQKRTRLRVVS